MSGLEERYRGDMIRRCAEAARNHCSVSLQISAVLPHPMHSIVCIYSCVFQLWAAREQGLGPTPPCVPGSNHSVCIRADCCLRNQGTRVTYGIDEQEDKASLGPGSWTAHWTFTQASHWDSRFKTGTWRGNRTVGMHWKSAA